MYVRNYVLVIKTCLDMHNHITTNPEVRNRRYIPLPKYERHFFRLPAWLTEKVPPDNTYKYISKGNINETADKRIIEELFSIHGCYCETECTIVSAYVITLEMYNNTVKKTAIKKHHDFANDAPIQSQAENKGSPWNFIFV